MLLAPAFAARTLAAAPAALRANALAIARANAGGRTSVGTKPVVALAIALTTSQGASTIG